MRTFALLFCLMLCVLSASLHESTVIRPKAVDVSLSRGLWLTGLLNSMPISWFRFLHRVLGRTLYSFAEVYLCPEPSSL